MPEWCLRSQKTNYNKAVACAGPAAAIADNVDEWIRLIGEDYFCPEYRNSIIIEWRIKYVEPITKLGPTPGNLFSDESRCNRLLQENGKDISNLSMYNKFVLAYGKEYADAYDAHLKRNPISYLVEQYDILRSGMGLPTSEDE